MVDQGDDGIRLLRPVGLRSCSGFASSSIKELGGIPGRRLEVSFRRKSSSAFIG